MRTGLILCALLALPLAIAAPAPSRGWEAPDVHAPWWELSMQDADKDRIDDALPRLGADPLRVLVAFADVPRASDLHALQRAGFEPLDWYTHFDVVVVETLPTQLPALARVPGVVFVERNDILYPLLKESVPLLGVPQVWQTYGVTGVGVTVAVLDDGSFEQHPDFQGKIAGRFDAGAPRSAGPDSPLSGVPVFPAGSNGHGTHIAGTIVGAGDQSNGQYKGVAPGARFANVKVFTGPNSTSSEIVLDGLEWTLANADALGIRIASLSLGGASSDGRDALSRAVDRAVAEGMIVVAAAGNQGPTPETIGSPGAAEGAITVGAVDKRKQIAAYSSRGPTKDGRLKPELVAPGTAITSTVPPATTTVATGLLGSLTGGGSPQVYYGQLSGTSMAAPHVSGVIALMLEVNPDLTPYEVKQILVATAQDLGAAGRDNDTGYGFVNAIAAAQVAADPQLLSSPQFAAILGTLPPPPGSTWIEDLQHGFQQAARSGKLLVLLSLMTVAALGVTAYVVVARRKP